MTKQFYRKKKVKIPSYLSREPAKGNAHIHNEMQCKNQKLGITKVEKR